MKLNCSLEQKKVNRHPPKQLAEAGLEPARGCPQGILSPLPKSRNPLQNKPITDTTQNDLASYLALLLQKYPDLARIIEAWPGLKKDRQQRILEIIGNAAEAEEKRP